MFGSENGVQRSAILPVQRDHLGMLFLIIQTPCLFSVRGVHSTIKEGERFGVESCPKP